MKGKYSCFDEDSGTTFAELLVVIFITSIIGAAVIAGIAVSSRIITGQFELRDQRSSVSKTIALMESYLRSNETKKTDSIKEATAISITLESLAGKGLVKSDGTETVPDVMRLEVSGNNLLQCKKEPTSSAFNCITLIEGVNNSLSEPLFKYYEIDPMKADCRALLPYDRYGKISNADKLKIGLIEVALSVKTPNQVRNDVPALGTQFIRVNNAAGTQGHGDIAACEHE